MITENPPPPGPPDAFFPVFAGQQEPFSTPLLMVWDSVRVFDEVFGGALIVGLIWLLVKTTMWSRKVFMVGILLLAVSAVGTEFEALGTIATYRLFFNTIGIVLCAVATGLAFRRGDP